MFGLRAPLDIKGRKQFYNWLCRGIRGAAWIVLGVTISVGAPVLKESRVPDGSTVIGVTATIDIEENLKYI